MGADVLFICHTQYQAMVSVVKVLCAPEGFRADFWLSAALPARAQLAARLQEAGLAGRTFLPQDNTEQYPSLADTSLLMRRTMAFKHAAAAGFPLRLGEYREICIYNDWNSAGRYLQDRGVAYVLGEDTYNNLDHPNHWIDDQAAEPDFARRQLTGAGYLFWGAYRGATAVEVARPETVAYYPGKLREFDVFARLKTLDAAGRAALRRVFAGEDIPPVNPDSCLFLSRGYYADREVFCQADQDRLCRYIVEKYAAGRQLFIKTHPRDETDYKALFPDAVVLNRFMPAELLDYCFDVRFGRAIGFGTNAVRNLRCADELIDIQDINLADFRTPPPEQEKG